MRNGYFDNARIIAKKIEGNQIWIEIQLKQRPKISQVTFTGVTKSERKDLEERTGLRAEMQLTPNIIDRTKQLVKKYFDEKGYSDMTVEVEQKNDLSKQNHALVTVVIDKKSKIKVSQIEFVGNKELSNNALRASMKKTNETFSLGKGRTWSSILEIFSQKKFIEKDYKEDLNNLLTRYHEAGYRDAEILSDTIVKDPQNPKRIKIQIKLDEGKKYTHGPFLDNHETMMANNIWGKGGYWDNSPFTFNTGANVTFDITWRVPYLFQGEKGGDGIRSSIMPMFTTDEALLNRAEAYIMLKKFDLAAKDLTLWMQNIVNTKRVLTPAMIQAFYNSTT